MRNLSEHFAEYTFDNFIEGTCNQLAKAAAIQVAENPGVGCNPLVIYGEIGLGKTHLMCAIGNAMLQKNPESRVLFVPSDSFVADVVTACQMKSPDDFKNNYYEADALLVHGVQFFANRANTQEQFLSVCNVLLGRGKPIILTSTEFPENIRGLDERLKSCFRKGLIVAVKPPALQTRVAILMKKAEQMQMQLPKDAAFFIAQRIRSNVRELDGVLKRVNAVAQFRGKPIDIDLIGEVIKPLFYWISIADIQKTVSSYYEAAMPDMLSAQGTCSPMLPRQMAILLSRELTCLSCQQIGDAFGGLKKSAVRNACKKMRQRCESDSNKKAQFELLLHRLTTYR